MNWPLIILGLIIAVIISVFFIYHSVTSSNSVKHTVVYDGATLYSGTAVPLVSSDGVSQILIATPSGLTLYDTDTKMSTIIDSTVATGVAYDENEGEFMILEGDGTFSNIISTMADGKTTWVKTAIDTGYTQLYDTTDGYLTTVGGVTTVDSLSGTTMAANGSYGMIQITIT